MSTQEDLKEYEEARRKQRERKPLLFCKWMVEYPKTLFAVFLIGHLLFLFITFVLTRLGYDIIPISFGRLPLNIIDDEDFLRSLAWSERDSDGSVIERGAVISEETLRSVPYDFVDLYFREENGNVLTKDNLQRIKNVEDDFFLDATFQADFCLLGPGGSCTKPSSILRFFDGSYSALDSTFNDPDFDNVEGVLHLASTLNQTKVSLQRYLGRNAVITSTSAVSEVTRCMLSLGLPLEGYANATHNQEQQDEDIKAFMVDSFLVKGDGYFESGVGPMEFVYNSFTLLILFISRQVFLDLALAGGSFLFIVFFVCFQTQSFWVGLFGILSIITSFFGANILYRVVFDFRYFGIFHVLAIFIILGIGADDLFVFFDNWKTTGKFQYPSLAHRLSDCYRKASLAMLFTSLTTAMAFIISAFSPFLTINSFGLFSGLLILVNYASVIIFFPVVVVNYHLSWEQYKCCCCCPKRGTSIRHADSQGATNLAYINENNSGVEAVSGQEVIVQNGVATPVDNHIMVLNHADASDGVTPVEQGTPALDLEKKVVLNAVENGGFNHVNGIQKEVLNQPSETKPHPLPDDEVVVLNAVGHEGGAPPPDVVPQTDTKGIESRRNFVVRFMAGPFFRFITHRIVKWVVVFFFFIVIILVAWSCSYVRVNEEQTKFLPDDSNSGKYLNWRANLFSTSGDSDANVQVYLIWGLDQQDLSSCHRTDFECTGETVWDPTFNMSSAASQQALMDFCQRLKNVDSLTLEALAIKRNLIDQAPEVLCFMDDMSDFYAQEGNGVNLPFDSTDYSVVSSAHSDIYTQSIPAGFSSYITVGLSYWLYNGFQSSGNSQWSQYNKLIGETAHETYTQTVTTPANKLGVNYVYGTELKYFAIVVNLTLERSTLGYPTGLKARDNWESWFQDELATMPKELQSGFQATPIWDSWHSCKIQKTLVSSAIQGILIGLAVVLVVLIVATGNFIVGLIGTFTICCITLCVIGMIPLAGWKLGFMESLNLVLVVGLSVDYVVHLAEGYSRSKHKDRMNRVHDMLEEVGISVVSGACTTLGASFFLLFAEILFFKQFGMFMFFTIGYSIIFAFFFFTAFLALAGPEKDLGKISNCFKICKK